MAARTAGIDRNKEITSLSPYVFVCINKARPEQWAGRINEERLSHTRYLPRGSAIADKARHAVVQPCHWLRNTTMHDGFITYNLQGGPIKSEPCFFN